MNLSMHVAYSTRDMQKWVYVGAVQKSKKCSVL
jgi:hypothetical protein